MPILDIEIVGEIPERLRAGLARRLADAAGGVHRSAPRQTWVKVRFVAEDAYSENGGPAPETKPVFVKVLLADPPRGEALGSLAESLTKAIAGACDRPMQCVHLLFEPPARGRISFGGALVD